MTNWIAAGHKPAAVIANNDNMAIGAINAMKAAGWDMKESSSAASTPRRKRSPT